MSQQPNIPNGLTTNESSNQTQERNDPRTLLLDRWSATKNGFVSALSRFTHNIRFNNVKTQKGVNTHSTLDKNVKEVSDEVNNDSHYDNAVEAYEDSLQNESSKEGDGLTNLKETDPGEFNDATNKKQMSRSKTIDKSNAEEDLTNESDVSTEQNGVQVTTGGDIIQNIATDNTLPSFESEIIASSIRSSNEKLNFEMDDTTAKEGEDRVQEADKSKQIGILENKENCASSSRQEDTNEMHSKQQNGIQDTKSGNIIQNEATDNRPPSDELEINSSVISSDEKVDFKHYDTTAKVREDQAQIADRSNQNEVAENKENGSSSAIQEDAKLNSKKNYKNSPLKILRKSMGSKSFKGFATKKGETINKPPQNSIPQDENVNPESNGSGQYIIVEDVSSCSDVNKKERSMDSLKHMSPLAFVRKSLSSKSLKGIMTKNGRFVKGKQLNSNEHIENLKVTNDVATSGETFEKTRSCIEERKIDTCMESSEQTDKTGEKTLDIMNQYEICKGSEGRSESSENSSLNNLPHNKEKRSSLAYLRKSLTPKSSRLFKAKKEESDKIV